MKDKPKQIQYSWNKVSGFNGSKDPVSTDNLDRILDLINRAEQIVVISSFLIADKHIEDAIVAQASKGVRVYILTAASMRLQQEVNNEFDEKARGLHVTMLKRLSEHALIRSSDRIHAKVVLADPGSNPAGMLLTANLTTDALRRNQELFVDLEKDEVVEANNILRYVFWEQADHEMLGPDRLTDCRPLGKAKPVRTQKILQTTQDHRSIQDEAMRILEDPKSVTVSSFGWDMDSTVVKKLCDLSKNGTKVTVITRNRKSTIPVMENMKKAGITIIGFKWLHAKAIVSDSSVMVMSANLDRYGLKDAFELGIRLEGRRAELVSEELQRYIKNPEYEFVLIPTNNSNKS